VKSKVRMTVVMLLFELLVCSGQAAFTSLYVFGDGVSTTTNGPGGSYYYGNRYSNGRVWVEVLAQRQGLSYESNKNWSYFGHYSPNLVANVSAFAAADADTALFVVWVNNADFVGYLSNPGFSPYSSNNIAIWTNAINQSVSNHLTALQALYAKGARTLVMPSAVDITKVPYYVALPAASKSFIRQRTIDFNAAFAATLNQARASLPGVTIHNPDLFMLLDNLLMHPADYGLTNALDNRGLSIDALSDPALVDYSLNGPGADYIFWDYLDPTARASAVIADEVQQLISRVQIGGIISLNGSNRLEVTHLPIGRDGFVDGSMDFVSWTTQATLSSTHSAQTIIVPAAGPLEFYRLRFPFSWSWP
jgi:phospholipase/lecithinase/hemolysin